MKGISEFFQIVREIQPDVMTGHNTENFDWNFIDVRLKNVDYPFLIIHNSYFMEKVYIKNKKRLY